MVQFKYVENHLSNLQYNRIVEHNKQVVLVQTDSFCNFWNWSIILIFFGGGGLLLILHFYLIQVIFLREKIWDSIFI